MGRLAAIKESIERSLQKRRWLLNHGQSSVDIKPVRRQKALSLLIELQTPRKVDDEPATIEFLQSIFSEHLNNNGIECVQDDLEPVERDYVRRRKKSGNPYSWKWRVPVLGTHNFWFSEVAHDALAKVARHLKDNGWGIVKHALGREAEKYLNVNLCFERKPKISEQTAWEVKQCLLNCFAEHGAELTEAELTHEDTTAFFGDKPGFEDTPHWWIWRAKKHDEPRER